MKSPIAAVCFGCLFLSQLGLAQDYPMQPNEEHEFLKEDVGVWDAAITMWMAGPEGETTQSEGVETVKMFGDFWSVSDFEYDFMGKNTVGRRLLGYDPSAKQYVGSWHETGTPYRALFEGSYDAESKQMTMSMTGKDPGGQERKYRMILRYPAADQREFEMHAQMPGSEDFVKMMEIVYKKR